MTEEPCGGDTNVLLETADQTSHFWQQKNWTASSQTCQSYFDTSAAITSGRHLVLQCNWTIGNWPPPIKLQGVFLTGTPLKS